MNFKKNNNFLLQPSVNTRALKRSADKTNDSNFPAKKRRLQKSVKKVGCPHCNKTFVRQSGLNTHIIKMHRSDKNACDVCMYECSSKREMKKHIMTECPMKPNFSRCKLCLEPIPSWLIENHQQRKSCKTEFLQFHLEYFFTRPKEKLRFMLMKSINQMLPGYQERLVLDKA